MSSQHSTSEQRSSRIQNTFQSDPSDWISGRWKSRLWTAFILFWIFYILAPPIMLVLISFDTASFIRIPQAFSIDRYVAMFQNQKIIVSIQQSLIFAGITTVIAPLFGLLAVLVYRKTEYKALMTGILILPLFIPGVVQGIGMLTFFSQLGIENTLFRVSVAHIIWALPFSFLVLLTSSSSITDDELLASSDLGANEFETFRYVIYPQLKPGLISATIFSFVLSFNEFSRTFYLIGNKNTVPTFVWASLQVEFSRALYAVAGFTVILSLGLIGIGTLYLYRSVE